MLSKAKNVPAARVSEKDTEAMKNIGKRLAELLYLATLRYEEKQEIIATVPFMNFGQIDTLVKLLEATIKESTGNEEKDQLAQKLQAITREHAMNISTIDRSVDMKLNEIDAAIGATEET